MARAVFMLATGFGIGALLGAVSDASACSCRSGSVEDAGTGAQHCAGPRGERADRTTA